MADKHSELQLHVVGPIALEYRGESVNLPRSKKCRALLSYLAVTGRPQRRDRLCDLFWDVADDPRGALRWTLSRLRSVLPKGLMPIEADRNTVSFDRERATIDAVVLGRLRADSISSASAEELEHAAALYRGEFLAGLELPDFLEFTAWCVAQREEFRRTQVKVLSELVQRRSAEPGRSLEWARQLVQVDAFSVDAHEALLRLLLAEGLKDEAELRYSHAERQFRQVAPPEAEALKRAWRALQLEERQPAAPTPAPAIAPRPRRPRIDPAQRPFVGRSRPLEVVRAAIENVASSASRQAVLVTAEPGGGKSRLLERNRSDALNAGFEVFSARAFDLERGRPFGPWLDALGLASDSLVEPAKAGGRAQIFEQFDALLSRGADGRRGCVLALDDVQWLDRDSADVLQHLMQTHMGPLLVLLAARGGELSDNQQMTRVIRTLKHDRVLKEIKLEPLTEDEVLELIGDQAPDDGERIVRASAGNPLYALELARGADDGMPGPPPTVIELVSERVSRLSDAALDVLRWGAVLGYAFDAVRLEALSELSQLDVVEALEELERHALLRIDATRSTDRYVFTHDIVREAVHSGLSHPRRRLMHRKVAHLLQSDSSDPATAYEVARHASLAGEDQLGVSACIEAGRYALRTCANADAEALAKRGLHHATDLDEPSRIAATLELLHVLYSARAPDKAEATERVRGLAERALDLGLTRPARIGFQMLSFLRWESSSMADAHANILQAERVSRSADPAERTQALAYAARCLVLLERNLPQAEAFAMEASGIAERSGRSSAAVAFALGMIAAHRGDTHVADVAFREAQDLARAAGERLVEFLAMEHRLMLALDGRVDCDMLALAADLQDLGAKVRPGAEVAIAGALGALARNKTGAGVPGELSAAIDTLREADAKYELAFVLTRRALDLIGAEELRAARDLAEDALEVSRAIKRVSEEVIATSALVQIARALGDADYAELARSVQDVVEADLSAPARAQLQVIRG